MNVKSEEYPDHYHKRWWERIISRVPISFRNRILIGKRRTEHEKKEKIVESWESLDHRMFYGSPKRPEPTILTIVDEKED